MRSASVLLALLLMLSMPAHAAADLDLKVTMPRGANEMQGGDVASFKGAISVDAGVGEDAVDLFVSFNSDPDKVSWPTTLTLRRAGTDQVRGPFEMGDGTTFLDVFEGDYDMDVIIQVPEVIGRFEADLLVRATSIDGRADTRLTSSTLIFSVTEGPDADRDGLSDAREAALGTDPNNHDTDGDTLTDCQEVKHIDNEECRDPYRTEFDGGFGTDPKKSDTDEDGIGDVSEVWGPTSAVKADTDDDGLSDKRERPQDTGTDPLNPDSDGDGLLDGDEIGRGTNPLNPDSDKDKISDGDEVNGTLNGAWSNGPTDPLRLDSDGDSLTDTEEILEFGTNPNAVDSDADGINDPQELEGKRSDPLKSDSDDDGLNDLDEIMTWYTRPWVPDTDGDGLLDGDEVHTHKTHPKEKDTDGDRLTDSDELNVWLTDPLNVDSDDDGLNDGDEVEIHNTDPAYFDTDRDGLSDGEEGRVFGTIPTIADFDEDLLNDGDEVQAGTNPRVADTDNDGYLDGHEFFYGGDPLEYMVTPPDLDLDFLTDAVDPDADGDGVDDDAPLASGLPGLGASIRYNAKIANFEAGNSGVTFSFDAFDGVTGYQLWRLDDVWVPVDSSTTPELTDSAARDGATYRISAYITIGAKEAGHATNASNIPWFDTLPQWNLIVTNVIHDGTDLRIQNGGDATDFVFVVNGETTSWPATGYGETRVPLSELAGGEYPIEWVDGESRRTVLYIEEPKGKDSPLPIISMAAAIVIAGIARRRIGRQT